MPVLSDRVRVQLPRLRHRCRLVTVSALLGFVILGLAPYTMGQAEERVVRFDNPAFSMPDDDATPVGTLHYFQTLGSESAEGPSGRPDSTPSSATATPETSPRATARSTPAPGTPTPRGPGPEIVGPGRIAATTRPRVAAPGILPPGPGAPNPSFIEDGLYVEVFWAVYVGTENGHFIRGHFHPRDLSTGFEGQHFGGARELHGFYVKAVDGRPFSLKSLRYRVTRNRELPGRSQSIEGFTNYTVNVLISTSFLPTLSLRGQFTAFPVGPPIGNDLDLAFYTLSVSGFGWVTQVFIASSASVDFDDIVIEPH